MIQFFGCRCRTEVGWPRSAHDADHVHLHPCTHVETCADMIFRARDRSRPRSRCPCARSLPNGDPVEIWLEISDAPDETDNGPNPSRISFESPETPTVLLLFVNGSRIRVSEGCSQTGQIIARLEPGAVELRSNYQRNTVICCHLSSCVPSVCQVTKFVRLESHRSLRDCIQSS